jgi:putative flavoprotein involved in K+ transport
MTASSDAPDVVVVGGGQAGLAVSHELQGAGVDHVVLERGRIGQTWRGWWDSFCLMAPNWTTRLPGFAYDGDDPDGFMGRDELVAYLERYAAAFGAPVRENVAVTALCGRDGGGFVLDTSAGRIDADTVVLATGAYQRPRRPAGAATLPADLPQLDVADYRSPDALAPGAVLVVGSGQSGCQIAEELREAGREVFLACGRAPWVPRRIGGRDIIWWAVETGFYGAPAHSLPHPALRLVANVQATGAGGGHDLHYRTLRVAGGTLLGHVLGADGGCARVAADLGASVAWGDQLNAQLMQLVRAHAAAQDLPVPEVADPAPFDAGAPSQLDLTGFAAVIFASGFRPDYESWVDLPGAFDEFGFPLQHDGASTLVPGLHFAGVHFQRKRQSSLLYGVGEDAAIVAEQIASRQRFNHERSTS